ncbi:hypothetical protein PF001_g15626 [Phytophthora fragariae]|uniref:Protein kinase domain-containing protein n=1 Tax=Phytophthora fragariae TaxID=53985 RepID=A0A6A4CZM6_9STRA|nr:hypothetical protein PF001_g15626 [Phytophthora fragariae]
MSTSQLYFRRKIGDALYGQVRECELRPTRAQEQLLPPLPIGKRRIVAVKTMSLSCAANVRSMSDPTRVMDDPLQECRVADLLSNAGGHPNVVHCFFHFQENDCIHLVTDFCTDGDLYTHVASAIQRGAMTEGWSIHISEFGLSVDANALCLGRAGKDYYMAPEVVAGEVYDPVEADIWSLGIMWFVMLTGSPLVSVASRQNKAFLALEQLQVTGVFESWGFDTKLSPSIIDLVSQMLKVNPAERISLVGILEHPCLNGTAAF